MQKIEFNDNWKFAKKGETPVSVFLPHDAMQTEKRHKDAESGSGCGFYKGNFYYYEKHFLIPEEWKGKNIWLEIQGAYPNGRVYFNGKEIGFCNYGYLNYFFSLTDWKTDDEENVLRIEVDNTSTPNSRWYSGAGLYRSVNVWIGGDSYIGPQSVKVTTEQTEPALIRVESKIEKNINKKNDLSVQVEILYQNQIVAKGIGSSLVLEIPDAKLWSDEAPYLYKCVVKLYDRDMLLDVSETIFGMRKIEYISKGLLVNGKETLLKGGCIHHDNGILGAREYKVSAYRKIKKLKEYGFNAIRSAHNPVSEEILQACDELGMYIMDESWDMWFTSKNKGDYAKFFQKYWEKDIEGMITRDYSHPSVIMYSIGNEVSEPAHENGIALARDIVNKCHELDKTRPVTCGINITILLMNLSGMMGKIGGNNGQNDAETSDGGLSPEQQAIFESLQNMDSTKFNEMASNMGQQMIMAAASDEADIASTPVLDLLDIAGYNYASSRYEFEGVKHPDRVIVGTETYPYQLYENWEAVKKYPYLIGDFMWTAWDYLGEAGVGTWSYEEDAADFQKGYPWLLADTGALDILGNPTGEAGLAKAVWEVSGNPFVGVVPVNRDPSKLCKAMWRGSNALPCYSYRNCEGRKATVEVYSTGEYITLYVNDKEVGTKKLEGHKAVFDIIYMPGELKAVSFGQNGEVLGKTILKSALGEEQIRISTTQVAQIHVPLYIDIDIVGSNGEIECNADEVLMVTVTGGKLLAFGSAIPRTEADFLEGAYPTWYGRSQAIVLPEQKDLQITVKGTNLHKKSLCIQVEN